MGKISRCLVVLVSAVIVCAMNSSSLAQAAADKGSPAQMQSEKGMGKGHADQGQAKAKKANHRNGKDLVGDKIKTNGHHVIDKKGDYTAAVDVQNGKIAGMKVTHATKGDIPVKKYKTSKKMAEAGGLQHAAFVRVQSTYIGTTYIGYSYIDEYGNEEIYWYPYDMILDGDTGAVEYVPAY
jgi:Ni/Co efflux regulator RcnB